MLGQLLFERCYCGFWVHSPDHFHIVLCKDERAAISNAQHLLYYHDLLPTAEESKPKISSYNLVEGVEFGLPGLHWVGPVTKNELRIYLRFVQADWGFSQPDIIHVAKATLEGARLEVLRAEFEAELHRRLSREEKLEMFFNRPTRE